MYQYKNKMTQLVIVLLILIVFLLSRDECVMDMVKNTINKVTGKKKKTIVASEPETAEGTDEPDVAIEEVAAASEASVKEPAEALPLGEAITGTSSGDVGTDSFMNSRELGGGWEPNYYDDALKLTNDKKEYVDSIKSNVDSEIIESHNEYVKDSNFLATTGSSHAAARDDFNPPVGWHGLPRRAHYASIGADSSARVFQSETASDIDHLRSHHSTEYCL